MAVSLPSIPRSYDMEGSVLQASALPSVPSLVLCFANVLWPGRWRTWARTTPQVSILPSGVFVLLSFCSLAVCLPTVLTIISWYNQVYSLYDFVYNWHRHAKFFSNFSMWGIYGIASTLLMMSNFSWFVGSLYFCSLDEVVMLIMHSVLICCREQILYTHTHTWREGEEYKMYINSAHNTLQILQIKVEQLQSQHTLFNPSSLSCRLPTFHEASLSDFKVPYFSIDNVRVIYTKKV